MLDNIEYKDYRKQDDIHGTILYPAAMVAPMQKDILNDLINSCTITSVFDPFHGSGIALYETMEIDPEMHIVGCDINPLANLITRVKLQGINDTIYADIIKLEEQINNPVDLSPFSFPNIDKWYRNDIKISIQTLRSAILGISDDKNRLYFWYMLCDILRKYSNTRSSTYKLHTKSVEVISRMENHVIEDYLKSVRKNVSKFNKNSNNFILYKCDILKRVNDFEDRKFDISITSPPYGDNATTVPYGQFSMLDLYTIAAKDLELEGWELENYSKIDNYSLGGRKKERVLSDFEWELINPYLIQISKDKQKKVINFFNDYFQILNEICRVTNKYIVLTLGNRTVDRVQINLTNISKLYLERNNFKNLKVAEREIPLKRTPRITSKVYQQPVNSMNKEYIIVHYRE